MEVAIAALNTTDCKQTLMNFFQSNSCNNLCMNEHKRHRFFIFRPKYSLQVTILGSDNNVRSLQAKVQWDVRFYFARRGRENLHIMAKDWFQVKYDEHKDTRYVVKVKDEQTKNHKMTDEPITSAFMPEMKGDKYCPVRSFLQYIEALSLKSTSLWKTAKFTAFPINNQKTWFYGTMGHNKFRFIRSRHHTGS